MGSKLLYIPISNLLSNRVYSLKYQKSPTLGCKDIVNKKFWQKLNSFKSSENKMHEFIILTNIQMFQLPLKILHSNICLHVALRHLDNILTTQ